jgi:hypothetical protein
MLDFGRPWSWLIEIDWLHSEQLQSFRESPDSPTSSSAAPTTTTKKKSSY